MFLRPDAHKDEYHHGRAPAGRSVDGPTIAVEQDEDTGVRVTLEPLPTETFDDRDVDRSLTAPEARELAAMLWHHAEEADRRAGLR